MTKAPSNAETPQKKQRGRPFPPGQSGNPAGKPCGARSRVTRAMEVLLEGEAEKLTRKAVELAMEGDTTALRLCMERLCPPVKDRPLAASALKLPKLTPGNLSEASAAIVRAVAAGRLTPSEGEGLTKLLEAHRKNLELQEIARRIEKLEIELRRNDQ